MASGEATLRQQIIALLRVRPWDAGGLSRALGIAHFHMLGENIAYNQGFPDPAGFAVQEWLLSPGHRANILRAEFQQSAIGVFVAANGTVYLTQEFMAR